MNPNRLASQCEGDDGLHVRLAWRVMPSPLARSRPVTSMYCFSSSSSAWSIARSVTLWPRMRALSKLPRLVEPNPTRRISPPPSTRMVRSALVYVLAGNQDGRLVAVPLEQDRHKRVHGVEKLGSASQQRSRGGVGAACTPV